MKSLLVGAATLLIATSWAVGQQGSPSATPPAANVTPRPAAPAPPGAEPAIISGTKYRKGIWRNIARRAEFASPLWSPAGLEVLGKGATQGADAEVRLTATVTARDCDERCEGAEAVASRTVGGRLAAFLVRGACPVDVPSAAPTRVPLLESQPTMSRRVPYADLPPGVYTLRAPVPASALPAGEYRLCAWFTVSAESLGTAASITATVDGTNVASFVPFGRREVPGSGFVVVIVRR